MIRATGNGSDDDDDDEEDGEWSKIDVKDFGNKKNHSKVSRSDNSAQNEGTDFIILQMLIKVINFMSPCLTSSRLKLNYYPRLFSCTMSRQRQQMGVWCKIVGHILDSIGICRALCY